jgi:hypothetical protein
VLHHADELFRPVMQDSRQLHHVIIKNNESDDFIEDVLCLLKFTCENRAISRAKMEEHRAQK